MYESNYHHESLFPIMTQRHINHKKNNNFQRKKKKTPSVQFKFINRGTKEKVNCRPSQLHGVEDHVDQEDQCPKNSVHVRLKRINFRLRIWSYNYKPEIKTRKGIYIHMWYVYIPWLHYGNVCNRKSHCNKVLWSCISSYNVST